MSLFYKEVSQRLRQEKPEFTIGTRLVDDLIDSLEKQGLLPEKLPEQKTPESVEQSRDLRTETFNLLGNLREPTAEEREALEKKGYIFTTIEAKSLAQVYDENPEYFDHVNSSEVLRAYTPPKSFTVAINPDKFRTSRSTNSSQAKQLRMIEENSHSGIELAFPDAKEIMLPATGYAQLDIKFQKSHDGKKLLPDFFARALDTTSGSLVADVGRAHPVGRLFVYAWRAGDGHAHVWASPAVVFLQK